MRTLKLFGVGIAIGLLALGPGGFGQASCTVTVQPGESIQKAIDQAAEGTVICLEAGKFQENIEIHKSLTLRGAGQDAQGQWLTQIESPSDEKYGPPVILISGDGNTHVAVLALAVYQPNSAADLQVEGQARVRLQQVASLSEWGGPSLLTKDSALVEMQNSELPNGVEVAHSSAVALEDVRMSGFVVQDSARLEGTNVTIKFGVTLRGKALVTLANSQILQGTAKILGETQARFIRVHLKGGESHGLWVQDEASLEIRQSTLSGYGGCGLFVDSPRAQVQGAENEFRENGVDLCGYAPAALRKPLVPQTERAELIVPDDYRSLQEAIDAIAPGGTITVRPGGYSGGLTIWKPLVLQGTPEAPAVIRPSAKATEAPTISVIAAAQGVHLEHLLLSGFTIKWIGGDARFAAGVLVYGEAALNLVQIDSHVAGVAVLGQGKVSLTKSQLHNNFVGVAAHGTSQVQLTGSQLFNNFFFGLVACTEFKPQGVVPERSSTVSVNNVIIFGHYGIALSGQSRLMLRDSTVRENTDWGVAAYLQRCGYSEDNFNGQAILEGTNVIVGNNTAGNHQGEVCLPESALELTKE